jgi:hypothetical protein
MAEPRKTSSRKEAMRYQVAWRYLALHETYDKFAHLIQVAPNLVHRLHIHYRQVFSEP